MFCGNPCYRPTCTIPSCSSAPVIPLGGCYGGSAAPASSLGIVPGVNPSCINQLPPSEVVIQPSPTIVTIPGPILSASCEPLAVGGYTPCASGSGGYLGYGRGSCCRPRRRFSICGSPC
uniref:Keratin n=2 Tax=Anolis carolinensis TaxID=28377 RepID=H9GSZ5_ANOCA